MNNVKDKKLRFRDRGLRYSKISDPTTSYLKTRKKQNKKTNAFLKTLLFPK